jgi:hypothetical protein
VGGKSLWTLPGIQGKPGAARQPLDLGRRHALAAMFDPASGLSISHPLANAVLAEQ